MKFENISAGIELTHFLTASHCMYDDYLKLSTKK